MDNQKYFRRVGQLLIKLLDEVTADAFVYRVDMRLREAWTWEHQALVRARVVVGDDRLRQKFAKIRRAVLLQKPDSAVLLAGVIKMRALMRTELAREDESTFDLKQGLGGIADIEFMVQYLGLKYACENVALLDFTDNVRQIECLQVHGFLDSQDATTLTEAYLYFRGRLHRRSLLEGTVTITIDEQSSLHREAISECWQKLMEIDD